MKATRGDIPTRDHSAPFLYLYLHSPLYLNTLLPQCIGTSTFDHTFCFSNNYSATWGHAPLAIYYPLVSAQVISLKKKQWIGTQESYQSGRATTGAQGNHGKRGRWRYSDMPGEKDCSHFCNRDIPRRQYQRMTPATKYGQLIKNTSRRSSHCGSCSRKPQKGPRRQW